jgi:DNA polymerase-3 subunit delta
MKIAPKAIGDFLKSPAKESFATLLYGPDSGLARERSQTIIAALLGKQHDPLSLLEVYQENLLEDSATLISELSAMSLMADKRVILIRQSTDKLTSLLEAALPYMRKDVYIIALADDLPSKSTLRSWFDKQPQAASVACYQDEERNLPQIIREQLSAAGINLPTEIVQYLASQMGNDRYVTRQEIEKIITYIGDAGQLSLEEARALSDYNRDAETDMAAYALADKNISELDTALARLQSEQVVPIITLRALSRYFQELYQLKLNAGNSSIESFVETMRPPVHFRKKPHLIRHAHNWSLDNIARALALISAAELATKTSDIPAEAASARKLMAATQIR